MFRAYDAGRERLVAVKLFKLDLPPERVHQLVAAFERLIAADLAHPSMAVPLATGINDVSAYLAQDYVAAESLDLAVREYGPAPAADAMRVAAQLAGALDFAAVVDIAHGALHPRDVLLSADETRITGVGVARALESVGVAVPIRRPYSPPERIAGRPWDRRADVFSLAALIHELLWGRRISGIGDYASDSMTELPGSDLEALKRVFARALAEDPNQRFETALEFVDSLKRAFPEVAVVPAAEPQQAAGRSRRNQPKTEPQHADPEPRLPLDSAPDDLELRAAEAARFEQVEVAPAVVPVEQPIPIREDRRLADIDDVEPPVAEPPLLGLTTAEREPDPVTLVERSRSAVWPLVAALVIGLALGFAAGYGVGTRERATGATDNAAATTGTPVDGARPTPGRDATEVAIADAAKPPPEQSPVASVPVPTPPPVRVEPPARESSPPPSRKTPVERRSAQRTTTRQSSQRPSSTAAARQTPPASQRTTDASATAGRYSGGLNVDSRPAGARVFLDGRLVGTTPFAMPSVPAGEHAIRLELDGYRRWSSSVRVVAAEQNRVTASLER